MDTNLLASVGNLFLCSILLLPVGGKEAVCGIEIYVWFIYASALYTYVT